jgi:SP family sugar:H+ symporter-like MFS transporter
MHGVRLIVGTHPGCRGGEKDEATMADPAGQVRATAGRSSTTLYVTAVAAGASLGGFLFGFDTSTMNSAINGIRESLDLGPGATGFVAAIALIGAAIGAWFAGPVTGRVGRNRVMLFAAALLIIGSVGVALSSQLVLIGVSRLASGLGIGAASATVPAYISEVAPADIRGRLGSLWQFAIVLGQLLGLISGYLLSRWAGSEAETLPMGGAAWRWMFVVVAIFAFVYAAVGRLLPGTPADLVRRGRDDEARDVLGRISDAPPDEQLDAIHAAQSGSDAGRRLGALRGPVLGLQAIVWAGLLLAAFQQLVGINVVKTYSNTLWQAVGFSSSASFTISIVTVLVSVASTVVAILLIDRVGRRSMLLVGAAVMAVALAALAISLSTGAGGEEVPAATGDVVTSEPNDVRLGEGASVVALVAINLFAVAFGITWGPVMWVMLSELFDSGLRTTAVAVCTAANWATNWLVTRTFPTLADANLGVAYGLYTTFAVAAFIFVFKALPETRGRKLA